MTVAELEQELKRFPPEMKVIINKDGMLGVASLEQVRGAVWLEVFSDEDYDELQFNIWQRENK